MEENNKIKIKLSTVIIFLILVLLIVGAVVYYIFNIKEKDNKIDVSNISNTTILDEKQETPKLTELPKIDGATAMLPMVGEIAKSVYNLNDTQKQEWLDKNTHGNTAQVYEELINKTLDVIFVSEPSDGILQDAKNAGVEFEMVGIGYDGFVFIENQSNPVDSLTIKQIQDIYTGKITNWKEVGGNDAQIIAYQREKNSGSQNLMEKMVMKDLKMMRPVATSLEIDSMSGLVDAVSGTEEYKNSKDALGYSIYLYAKEQYVRDNIKFLKINGIEASDKTIADGTYSLKKTVYAVYRKDEKDNEKVTNLINWLKTEEGQKSVINGGYVGLAK